jgi:hypothetical protein
MNKQSLFSILLALTFAAMIPISSPAQFSPCVSAAVNVPPPALPTYQQPVAPAANYQWEPGYWGWNPYGYYWVPGVWVQAPAVGLYWTPGYWSFSPTGYVWIQGYWGPSVGFYGGINYGYGYYGAGFVGGYWNGGTFNYNTAVANVNSTVIHNVYSNSGTIAGHTLAHSRASFNGGHGGISAKPTRGQIAAGHARRFGATPAQTRHAAMAGANSNNLVAFNHGKPPVTTMQHTSGTVRGQPGFRALTTHQQNLARAQGISRAHMANAPATHSQVASHGTISGGGSHWARNPSGSRGTIGGSRYHGTSGSFQGSTRGFYGGYHGSQRGYYGSQRGYGSPRGFYGASNGFRGSPGGFRGSPGGFRGSAGGFRGSPGGFRGSPGGFRGSPGGVSRGPGRPHG